MTQLENIDQFRDDYRDAVMDLGNNELHVLTELLERWSSQYLLTLANADMVEQAVTLYDTTKLLQEQLKDSFKNVVVESVVTLKAKGISDEVIAYYIDGILDTDRSELVDLDFSFDEIMADVNSRRSS